MRTEARATGRLARGVVAVACALVMGLVAPRAHAQAEEGSASTPTDGSASTPADGSADTPSLELQVPFRRAVDVLELPDDELQRQGWRFERQSVVRGSALGGLLAITVGTVWHGVGHFAVGDRPSMWRLLAMEGAAAGLLTTSVLTTSLASGEAARASGRIMGLSAASLFLTSWVADAVGAIKGSGADLPENTVELRGLAGEVYYTLVIEDGLDITNLGVARLSLITRNVVVVPEFEFETDLDYLGYGVYGAWRQPLSRWHRQTFLETGLAIREDRVRSADLGRTQCRARVQLSYDLGGLLPHIRGLVWRNAIEVSTDHVWFRDTLSARFDPRARTWSIPFEFSLSANVNRGVNLQAGYRSRQDLLVGQASSSFGVVFGRVSVLPVDRLGIDLQLEQGAWVRLWLGFRYVLAGRQSN